MALFQKKPQYTSSAPLYSVGANRTLLIIGLGNPGKQYGASRHNFGFAALDNFAEANDFPPWTTKKAMRCRFSSAKLGDNQVVLCLPLTYMNLSGQAARSMQSYYKIANSHTLAVYDELAIPFGQIRARVGGSDAGHNGVKSLIQHLGEDFYRLRLGIGAGASASADSADFVLANFTPDEESHLSPILREASSMIMDFIFNGSLKAETRDVL